jgi:ribosomal protein S18 acetylase RimI-like enzyme
VVRSLPRRRDSRVHLEVNGGNPAIDLYRRFGFEEHGRSLLSKRFSDPLAKNS